MSKRREGREAVTPAPGQDAANLLTRRQREILTRMADHPNDDGGELVLEGRDAYLDLDRTSSAMVWSLVRLMAIRNQNGDGRLDRVTRWRINETGRKLIGRP